MAGPKQGGKKIAATVKTIAPGVEEITLKIAIEASEDCPTYYVNFAEVSSNMHEFAIGMARLPTKFPSKQLEAAKEKGVLRVEPTVQVIVPVTLVPGLIGALKTQLGKYEKAFGPVRMAKDGEAT